MNTISVDYNELILQAARNLKSLRAGSYHSGISCIMLDNIMELLSESSDRDENYLYRYYDDGMGEIVKFVYYPYDPASEFHICRFDGVRFEDQDDETKRAICEAACLIKDELKP